jgi:ClpP class serine protease
VAEGRVWTGRQALAHGLVDRLGGIEETLDELRRRLALAPGTRLAIERREAPRPLWQRALGLRLPTGVLAGPLAVLAPALRGERVLAIMPFVMDFVRRGRSAAADMVDLSRVGTATGPAPSSDAPAGVRLVVRAVRRIVAAFREPPLVM